MSTPSNIEVRRCRVCGVEVGWISMDGHWTFTPNARCAIPVGKTYRCVDHPEEPPVSDLVAGEEIPPEDEGCYSHIEPDPDEAGVDVVHPDQLGYWEPAR